MSPGVFDRLVNGFKRASLIGNPAEKMSGKFELGPFVCVAVWRAIVEVNNSELRVATLRKDSCRCAK